MKLTKAEQKTLEIARRAVMYLKNGDPVKDMMDDNDIEDALELLVKIAYNGLTEPQTT